MYRCAIYMRYGVYWLSDQPRLRRTCILANSLNLSLPPPPSLSLLCARTREHTVGTGDADEGPDYFFRFLTHCIAAHARLKTDFSSNISRSRAGLNVFATRLRDYAVLACTGRFFSNRNVTCKFLTVFLLLPHGVNCHATSNLILCDTTQTYFIINLAIKMILSDKTSIIHCLSTKNSLVMLYIQNVQPSGAYPGFLERGVNMYKGVWVRFADFISFS